MFAIQDSLSGEQNVNALSAELEVQCAATRQTALSVGRTGENDTTGA